MSGSEPPGSCEQATDLDVAEREFVASMDAIQEYLQLQSKLQDQLKQGLLSLARAKYSMGPIGQAQYDNEMTASVRIVVSSGEEEAPAAPTASSSGRHSLALQRVPPTARPPPRSAAASSGPGEASQVAAETAGEKAPTATAAAAVASKGGAATSRAAAAEVEADVDIDFSDEDAEGEGDEGLREANEFLRRMRMEAAEEASGSGVGGVDGGGDGAAGASQQQQAQQRQRRRRRQGGGGDPLHWFGVLVPPALKEAQREFAAALDTCLRLVNTGQQVLPKQASAAPASAPAT